MIIIGKYNTLKILRSTSVGLYLGDDDGTEVLLPGKYVQDSFELGDSLKVFCYLDGQERPIATTLKPKIERDGFAYLKVDDITQYGAFVDWGLEKHLLVPFREQSVKMKNGHRYIIHCYLDEESFRLVGSTRLNRFFDHEEIDLQVGDQVDLLAIRKTNLGWEVIIKNRYKGLLFFSDIFKPITVGDTMEGYIKNVREDGKIDVTLQPIGFASLEPSAQTVFEKLKLADGFLPVHDKSDPEVIYETFQMSKKTFKKAIGVLYKARNIIIKNDGIYLS